MGSKLGPLFNDFGVKVDILAKSRDFGKFGKKS